MVSTHACWYTQLIDSKIMRAMKWITEWKPAWVLSLAGQLITFIHMPTTAVLLYKYHSGSKGICYCTRIARTIAT